MPPKKTRQSSKDASSSKGASSSRRPSTSRGETGRRLNLWSSRGQDEESAEPLPWEFLNAEDELRYQQYGKRTLLPSKYKDDATLEHLELLAEVEQCIASIGWSAFMDKKFDSYSEITKEMMFSFSSTANQWHKESDQVISFQCMGVIRQLSLGEVHIIMGIPQAENWFPTSFNVHEAWNELTGQPKWVHSFAKSTYLINPALRYIHRVLVHTIFGRADSMGSVTMAEVFLLWSMMKGKQVDGSLFLVRHLANIAGSTSGLIRVGGIVTAFAQYFGFDPDEEPRCTKLLGKDRIDLATMENMQMIRKQGSQYYLIGLDGHLIPKQLPHDVPPQSEPAVQEGEAAGGEDVRMVDLGTDSMQQTVSDVLQKRRWISAGGDGSLRMESSRPPQPPVAQPSSSEPQVTTGPPNFFPLSALEGSVYLLAKKMDRMYGQLDKFAYITHRNSNEQETRRQQFEQQVNQRFEAVDRTVNQRFDALDRTVQQRFDSIDNTLLQMARQWHISPHAPLNPEEDAPLPDAPPQDPEP